MSTLYAYLGYVNSEQTEGRGTMVPEMVTFDIDVLAARLPEMAGYTGMFGSLVEVDPPAPRLHMDGESQGRLGVKVLGFWRDELGDHRYGLLPLAQPEQWDAKQVENFRRLARKFPELPTAEPARALLHQTLPKPVALRIDLRPLFLLVADGQTSIAASSYPGQLLRALYSSIELAQAGARDLRAAEPDLGRLHILRVTVVGGGAGSRYATFSLSGHATDTEWTEPLEDLPGSARPARRERPPTGHRGDEGLLPGRDQGLRPAVRDPLGQGRRRLDGRPQLSTLTTRTPGPRRPARRRGPGRARGNARAPPRSSGRGFEMWPPFARSSC